MEVGWRKLVVLIQRLDFMQFICAHGSALFQGWVLPFALQRLIGIAARWKLAGCYGFEGHLNPKPRRSLEPFEGTQTLNPIHRTP